MFVIILFSACLLLHGLHLVDGAIQPSSQPTRQPSSQPSELPTVQPTSAPTSQPSDGPTKQPSSCPTSQPSFSPSSQPSRQPTSLPSSQPSTQPSSQPSTPSSQPSSQPSEQPSTQPSAVPSAQPSTNPTAQPTMQPTVQPSKQPSSIPSSQPTIQPSSQPSRQPSFRPSTQPSTQPSSLPSAQPSSQPSSQPSQQPSALPSSQPTCQPSSQPTNPTTQPSSRPSVQPSTQPSSQPSEQPSARPTTQPSAQPSIVPSRQPSSTPTSQPSCEPSVQPSSLPTMQPSSQPSALPSMQPSSRPSGQPTIRPSAQPSSAPSSQPSSTPTCQPSRQPTSEPTAQPSAVPSLQPFASPTSVPSAQPSTQPSSQPTSPTSIPTNQPSSQPSAVPSQQPSAQPTSYPSPIPPCPAGSYYNLTGHSNAGDPVVTDYYECHLCKPGTFTSEFNQSSCKICAPGFYSERGSTECTICGFNTYAERNGSASCTRCQNPNEVIGVEGSFSAGDCFNPAINFIMGSVALMAAVFAIIVYMWFGRLHRIAFQRKFRLIRKLIMMYGVVLTTADMITRASILLSAMKAKGANINMNTCYQRVVKPGLFLLVCLVVIPGATLLYVFQTSIKIVFNAMVLWRAYKRLHGFDFTVDFLIPFLKELGDVLQSRRVVEYVSYPLLYILPVISNLSINLNAVEVTCPGAQAPLYLLTDMIIVAVVIIVIESDVHVFWTMMVAPVMGKIKSMVYSGSYLVRNRRSTSFYVMIAMYIPLIPGPDKLVQYSMGFVVMRKFFNFGGSGINWVNRNDSCDGAVGIPMDSILSFLSALFAIIVLPAVIYLLSVVLFAVKDKEESPTKTAADAEPTDSAAGAPLSPSAPSGESAPSPHRREAASTSTKFPLSRWEQLCKILPFHTLQESSVPPASEPTSPSPVEEREESVHSEEEDYAAVLDHIEAGTAGTWRQRSTCEDSPGEGEEKSCDSGAEGDNGAPYVRAERQPVLPLSPFDLDEQPDNASRDAPRRLKSTLSVRYLSPIQTGAPPMSPAVGIPIPRSPVSPSLRDFSHSPSQRKGLGNLRAKKKKDSQYGVATLSKRMRVASSFFAIDWMLLKGMYQLGVQVFSSQRNFFLSKYMLHTAYRASPLDPKTFTSKDVKVYVDAFTYDKDLKKLRKYASSAQLRTLPLCDGLVTTNNAERVADRKEEDKEWKIVKTTLPSYYELAQEVYEEMEKIVWLKKYFPYCSNFLCHFFLAQIFLTKTGLENWLRVAKTYFGMILFCIGIWPEWLVEDFEIIKKFEEFNTLTGTIYNEVGDGMFSEQAEDAFTKIDNDERVAFGQFVAALTTCRIALLQMSPYLTLWALFASAVAPTPLFVFSDEMRKQLPPLLALDAYDNAKALLEADYNMPPSKKSKDSQEAAVQPPISEIAQNSLEGTGESPLHENSQNPPSAVDGLLLPESAQNLSESAIEPPSPENVQNLSEATNGPKSQEKLKKPPKPWSRLQLWFLTYYIFFNQSRLIQFLINGFENIAAVAIIFFPENLKNIVIPLVIVMLHQGLLSSLYVVLLFRKLMFPMESDELNFGGEIEAQDVMGLAKGVLFSGAPPESGKGSGAAGEAGSKKTPTKAGKNAAPDDDLTLGDIELMHVSARTPPPAPPPISRLSMRRGGSLRLEELRPDSHRYLASSKGSSKKNPMQGSLYSMSSMGSMDGGGEDGNGNGGGDGSTGNSAAPEQMPLSRRNAAWRSDEPSPTVPRSASSIDFASASGSTRNSPVPGSPLSVGVSDTAAQTPGFLL